MATRLPVFLLLSVAVCAGPETSPAQDPLRSWIGQMLMVGFRGTDLDSAVRFRQQLVEVAPGGVILSDYDVPSNSRPRNIESPEQLSRLIDQLQSLSETPLLVAVDQEGGQVARLKQRDGFEPGRPAAELGRLDLEEATRKSAAATARQLAQVGINLNLAPVVDLDLNPENPIIGRYQRSFGAQADKVVRHATWFVQEHRSLGVLTALKHFPGHGSSLQDSHLGLPDVTAVWQREELQPFKRLIEAGQADLVMTAHLYNSRLDPELPASLSAAITTGILRAQLGFDGPIVTDDLGMGALTERWTLGRRIQLAIAAGADILLLANNFGDYDPDLPVRAAAAVEKLVVEGSIERERIRRSYDRILALKSRAGLLE